jgi:hypothetical protein
MLRILPAILLLAAVPALPAAARGHCPPGLARKRNGCLPPGQARKRYAIGHPLPAGIVVIEVPAPLLGRLPRLEPGTRYGMVDGDLLKLSVGTLLVVDAIDGMLR